MSRAIFDKMYDASQNQKSDYFKKGSGTCVVTECLLKNSADTGETFILRAKIVDAKPKDPQNPCNSPGDRVGWPQLLTKFPRTAFSNVQGLVLAIVGAKKEDVSKDDFVATYEDCINYQKGTKSEFSGRLIEAVQAARGMLLSFDTYDQQTKAQKAASEAAAKLGQKVFETNTYVRFYHVADQGDLAARVAELDKTDPLQG